MLPPEIQQQHTVRKSICKSAMQCTEKLANITKACVLKTCASKPGSWPSKQRPGCHIWVPDRLIRLQQKGALCGESFDWIQI